jgi:4-hydroxy-tetrahydrodipicolinate reductase
MNPITVLVSGAKGRMGQEVVRAVRAEADLRLVGETDLGDDLAGAIRSSRAQVVVDFTHPDAAAANTEAILRSGASPVVGTTGFTTDDIRRLQELATSFGRGGVIAPNFAIGAVLLMRFAAEAARFFPDVEIIELHHERKVDAPSGTALKTAELIRERLDRAGAAPNPASRPGGHEIVAGARGGKYLDIPIHSVRLPGFVAHQEVIFGGPGQILTLRHDAPARESFMPGVILAVREAPALERLVYGLEAILEL